MAQMYSIKISNSSHTSSILRSYLAAHFMYQNNSTHSYVEAVDINPQGYDVLVCYRGLDSVRRVWYVLVNFVEQEGCWLGHYFWSDTF